MPPSEPYVTDNEKKIIKWWINHTLVRKRNFRINTLNINRIVAK